VTNWKEYKLSDLMQIKYGKDHKHLADGSYPLYGSGGIMRYVEKPLYEEESILIPRKGTLSNLFYLNEPFWSVDTMFYSQINKELALPKYLYYTLKTFDLASLNVGSAVPSLTTQVLNEVLVSVPDLPTQTAIAEILSSLDDKIELNNKINQELENLAQTLFKQWFIDFEFPNENGKPYKSSGGALVDSELGQIPKGWEVVNFKDTIEKYIDNRGKTPPVISDGIPIVEVKHMSDSSIFPSLKTQKFVSQEVYENWFRAYLEEDDLLMSTVGTIGRLNITPKDEIFAIAQNVLGLRFKKEILTQLYMFCLMRSKLFNDEINSRLIITVQASIKRSDLEKIPVVIPDYSILNNFDIQVRTLFDEISNLTKENQELTNLRDTLLPKLISGELEVADIMAEKA